MTGPVAMPDASSVLDASAVLAYLFDEPGAERFVRSLGEKPVMSAVNWSEVSQKCAAHRVAIASARAAADAAGLQVVDLTADRAERAAELWPATRALGLSLADRACLALALELRRPTVTADRTWTQLAITGLEVRCLR